MAMDQSTAIKGLDRTDAALHEYAAERNLTVAPDPLWPGVQNGRVVQGPIAHAVWSVTGRFPGGTPGRLRHQAAFGSVIGHDFGMQHTIFVTRIPQSVGFLPMLNLRPGGIGGGLFAWAGDKRPREKVEFESIELGRRYVIEVAKGQGQNWLYQLFTPTFINWLAANTPPDFGFRLDGGVFTCECPQWRGQETRAVADVDPEYLDLLSSSAGRVASRIGDEVDEEVGTGGEMDPDSAAALAERMTAPKYGRLIRAVLKVAGGDDSNYSAATLGEPHGFGEKIEVADFHAQTIRLPLPGTATGVARGHGNELGREGWLAWIDYESPVDMARKYMALVTRVGPSTMSAPPSGWLDADDATIPVFGEGLPEATVAAARQAGYGLSSGGGFACVYAKAGDPWEVVDENKLANFVTSASAVLNTYPDQS